MRVNMGREGRASSSLSANGGTMLGSLILANGPSQPLEAATKYYVDTVFGSLNANNILEGILPISSLPAFTGDAFNSQGSNSFVLTNIGVNPGSYAKVIVDAKGRVTGNDVLVGSDIPNFDWTKVSNKPSTIADYGITDALSTNGGTVNGRLSVSNPTQSMSAVNKQYVDSALSGNSAVVGDIIRKPYSTTPSGFLRCNGGQADKTLYPELYAAIGDTYSVNTTKGAGRPWEQQYEFNTYQTENITGWSVNSQSCPVGILYHKAIVTKNRVYLIGGGNSSSRYSTVYMSVIQSDGTLGAFSSVNSLPGEFAYFSAVVTKNRVYLIGGGTNTVGQLTTVYTTSINSDGTLGTWTTAPSLPVATNTALVVVIKNRIWMMGGGTSSGITTNIYYATINSDGTINNWVLYDKTLVEPISASQVVVTKNRVYIIGGTGAGILKSTIYTCPINLDGTLGNWSISNISFPINITVGTVAVTKNCVYMIGGAYATDTYTANTYKANINPDGTLGTWEYMANLNYTAGYSTSVIVKNKIYLLGGYLNNGVSSTIMVAQFNNPLSDYSEYYTDPNEINYLMPGSGKPWQQQYQTNNAQSGVISGWMSNSGLPATLGNSGVVMTKNRVYIIGGTGGAVNTVYTAPINTDGTLGAWATDIPIPAAVSGTQVIVTKNYAYILGGYNGSYLSTVYRAPINSDGSLGIWTTDTALPGVLGLSQALVTKNRVYLIGGMNGAWTSTVYTAPINTDGTIGTWVATTSLPSAVGAASIAVTKNRVYLIGGWNSGALSSVYTATINSDGYLGPWVTSTSLPVALGYTSTFVSANKVYVVGGYNGAGVTSVYTSEIGADGTLGSWSASTPLTVGFSHSSLIVTSSKIYLLGGYDTAFSNTIFQADISGGSNDYTAYYDGSIIPADVPDTSMYFTLPDFTSKEKNGSYLFMKY